jgi:ketosteroid isomerase-like protein
MRDPIAPPAARVPEEALELVAQAFSDGDIEAALAQYEDAAQLLPWAWPVNTSEDLRTIMARLMALRLPLSVQIQAVLQARGLTVAVCERRIAGIGPDCEKVQLTGHGFAAIRPQPDGTWRIAADAWCLEPAIPLDPPEVPPGAEPKLMAARDRGGQPPPNDLCPPEN